MQLDRIKIAALLRALANELDPQGCRGIAATDWFDCSPSEAARVLGISRAAMWARLRVAEGRALHDGRVGLDGNILAYRVGRRWRIRLPRSMAGERATSGHG